MKKGIIGGITTIIGTVAGIGFTAYKMDKELDKVQSMSDKHFELFKMMNQWVKVKQEGKNLSTYFENKGYKNIAVYGLSFAGETLIDELKNTSTKVAYGIDRNASNVYMDIEVCMPTDNLREVDAVVVTSITYFNEIEDQLCEVLDCPIISLEDVLYEI